MVASPREFHAVGRSFPKPDAWLKATGSAAYAGDLRLPGMLESRVLRSPHPHARVVAIDVTQAEALPGVYAVVTGRDVPAERIGNAIRDRHALARDKVTYVGEPVAAVAAVDEETAERALALIEVQYEPLAAVFDAVEALQSSAPIVHPDLPRYAGSAHSERERNQRSRLVHEVGDVDAAFLEAGLLVHEATYLTPRQSPGFTEPHAALAQVDATGKVTVWASNKAPFRARVAVADTFKLPLSRVRMISPVVGGDFGGKPGGFIEPIVALLARKARRPVRLVLSRVEELTSMTSRPGYVIHLKMAAHADGTIVALEGRQVSNLGAVDDYGPDRATRPASLVGAYRIPNVRVSATAVYTNTSPSGHVRAPSGPQNHFALESHVDALARMLGMDPFDFRLKNILQDGDVVPSGHGVLRNSGLEECIRRARTWVSRLPPRGASEGVGIAIGSWALGPKLPTSDSAASVKIDVDGSVVLFTGVPDQGGGQWAMAAQVASEVLEVPPERVSVVAADTEATPYETGIGGSNVTYRVGNSVRQAAEDARRKLLAAAAASLGADEEELSLRDGQVVSRSDPGRSISLAEVAHAAIGSAGGAIFGSSTPIRAEEVRLHGREQREIVDAPSFSCHAAQVRVDPQSGQVEVLRYFAAQDVGRALNPMNCEGQIQGGVVFGLGYALSEEIVTDHGTPLNANLWEYLLPTAPHVPDLTVELVQIPSTYGPFGAKGIGENPCIPVAAAIANAVANAIDVRVRQAPVTPERVLAAIRAQRS